MKLTTNSLLLLFPKPNNRGSEMVGNRAEQGGGVYADAFSTLNVQR